MDFSQFDTRRYPTLSVIDGYRQWADSYEDTVLDVMDLRLLERSQSIDWANVARAADLACGTGRIGAWLKSNGVQHVDGLDLTPEMLKSARSRGVYAQLHVGDVTSTPLATDAYDLVTMSLADEHIEDLMPMYAEVARLLSPDGRFVIVGYHPHFLLKGIPTHFDGEDGQSLAIKSFVHLTADHVRAALAAGLTLIEMDEGVIDDQWIAQKPSWKQHAGEPVSFLMVWKLASGQ